ncbi:unnamed protein product [Closterium sp. Yama58-4]|nr:unnamed protein product [Closterium sp. Yama58-4]
MSPAGVPSDTAPPAPAARVPELLGRGSLARTLLRLPLATSEPPTLHRSTAPATRSAAATTATTSSTTPTTAAAATTPCAATDSPTTRATPTSATTPAPPTPSTAAAPTSTSTTSAPLALAALAPPTGSRRSPDSLSSEGAGVTTRATYSYNALLSC